MKYALYHAYIPRVNEIDKGVSKIIYEKKWIYRMIENK